MCGRDTGCSIYIDNNKISRKQFEIQKNEDTFFVRDLGSINVTLLNGRALGAEDWTQLSSGDMITVAEWTLQFELRDAQFEKRLQEVDPKIRNASASNSADLEELFQDEDIRTTPAQDPMIPMPQQHQSQA